VTHTSRRTSRMVIFDFSVGWRDGKAAGHCCIFQALSAYPGDCLAIVRRQGWHLKGDLIRQSENELPHPRMIPNQVALTSSTGISSPASFLNF
jgi:hypothetical protein